MDIFDFLDIYWDGKKKRFFVPAEYIEDGYVKNDNGTLVLCFSTNEGDFELELDPDSNAYAILRDSAMMSQRNYQNIPMQLADEDIKCSISNFDDGYSDLGISTVDFLFYVQKGSSREIQLKAFVRC